MEKGNIRRDYMRLHEIDYMFIFKGYTVMMLQSGEQDVIDIPLAEIERQVCDDRFFRIHRSYIVNLAQIKGISFSEQGMSIRVNGHELPVSRRRKRALLKVLNIRRKKM